MAMGVLAACDAQGTATSTNRCDRAVRVGLFLPHGEITQLNDDNSTLVPVGAVVQVSNVFGASVDYGYFRVIVGTDTPLGAAAVKQDDLENGTVRVPIEGECGPGTACTFVDDRFDCG